MVTTLTGVSGGGVKNAVEAMRARKISGLIHMASRRRRLGRRLRISSTATTITAVMTMLVKWLPPAPYCSGPMDMVSVAVLGRDPIDRRPLGEGGTLPDRAAGDQDLPAAN
jgi:hypothetical protein